MIESSHNISRLMGYRKYLNNSTTFSNFIKEAKKFFFKFYEERINLIYRTVSRIILALSKNNRAEICSLIIHSKKIEVMMVSKNS